MSAASTSESVTGADARLRIGPRSALVLVLVSVVGLMMWEVGGESSGWGVLGKGGDVLSRSDR